MLNKGQFISFFSAIPKAELHLHVEGVVSRKTTAMLLNKLDPSAHYDIESVGAFFNFNNLSEFVESFITIQKAFQEPRDFEALFNDLKDYLIENGIIYTETYLAPTTFIRNGLDFEFIIKQAVKMVRRLKRENKITIKFIIDVSRTFGLENAMKNLDVVLDLRKKYPEIIGIGLGGDEKMGPAGNFAPVFKKARDAGLNVVAHAGESVGPESVRDAIELLQAQRIGHGISSIFDKNLVEDLAKRKIPLEICPTSNMFTKHYFDSYEKHPAKQFFDAGVVVTISTDDPSFFGANLIDEYYYLYSKWVFLWKRLKLSWKIVFVIALQVPLLKIDG